MNVDERNITRSAGHDVKKGTHSLNPNEAEAKLNENKKRNALNITVDKVEGKWDFKEVWWVTLTLAWTMRIASTHNISIASCRLHYIRIPPVFAISHLKGHTKRHPPTYHRRVLRAFFFCFLLINAWAPLCTWYALFIHLAFLMWHKITHPSWAHYRLLGDGNDWLRWWIWWWAICVFAPYAKHTCVCVCLCVTCLVHD